MAILNLQHGNETITTFYSSQHYEIVNRYDWEIISIDGRLYVVIRQWYGFVFLHDEIMKNSIHKTDNMNAVLLSHT